MNVNSAKGFSKHKFVKKVLIAREKGVMNLLCYEPMQGCAGTMPLRNSSIINAP